MFKVLKSASVLFLADQVDARRYLDDKLVSVVPATQEIEEATGIAHSPLVTAADCDTMCLFNDGYNKFCYKFRSSVLTAGWEWTQFTTTAPDTWRIQWKPYTKTYINFAYDFVVDRLFNVNFIYEIPEF